MTHRLPLDGRALGCMLTLCLVWGVQQVALKATASAMAPMLQIGLRSAIAAGLVALWMRARGERGSIVTLLCDRGKRYQQTLFDPAWRNAHGLDITPWQAALHTALATGTLTPPDQPA